MHFIKFDKTVCGVNILLNVIDFQSDCPFEFVNDTISADFFQIYFFKKVSGFLKLNDQKIELENNSVIFISKDQHHSWHGDFSSVEGHLLLFQDDFLNHFFSDQYFIFRFLYFYQSDYPLKLLISDDELIDNLTKLSEVKHELVNPKNDSVHLIRSLLYYILIDLNRKYAINNQIKDAITLDNSAYQFRKLVEKYIKTKQRVEDYSDEMKISRVSLNKIVKKQFNITATEFIKSRLLFAVKMELIHSSKTISEIAHEFHFSEANHFSRFFKAKTDKTPIEYREDYQNGIPL